MAVHINGIFENEINEKIRKCKLLVVGAGGIGCELLKNLVTMGFEILTVIDLDTIELSNLNRQFLFHKQHIGKPKAVVAKESVLKFNPKAQITAYHDSIFNPKFDVEFFSQFTAVTNALDNVAARSHVNRMCLAANIPLIESGTSGYYGHVTTYKKGVTECFECIPHKGQKSYPGCTIRNTPSEPVHCIVWAKHLFNQLFGETDIDEEVSPDAADPELNNTQPADGNVQRKSTREWVKEKDYDPVEIFNKLFKVDIGYLNTMTALWETRKRPIAFIYDEVPDIVPGVNVQLETQIKDQKLWTLKDCRDIFCKSVISLREKLKSTSNEILTWDKDDDVAMDFVASVANLRAACFNIEQKSRFDIKSIAGNIVPAIATSNAVIAGLIVLNLLHVIKGDITKCRNAYLNEFASGVKEKKFIGSSEIAKLDPKKSCMICSSNTAEISIMLNCHTLTVRTLNDKILKETLHFAQPDVMVNDGSGKILLSSEPDEMEGIMDKPLSTFGVISGSRLLCEDEMQNIQCNIVLRHNSEFRDQEFEKGSSSGDMSQLIRNIETARETSENSNNTPQQTTEENDNENEDDDDLEMLFDDDEDEVEIADTPKKMVPPKVTEDGNEVLMDNDNKRKLSDDGNGIGILPTKKQKVNNEVE